MFNTTIFYCQIYYFHLDTLCFNDSVYVIEEDKGPLVMTLTLSRALPFDISVNFLYHDRTSFGKLVTCIIFIMMQLLCCMHTLYW